MVSSLCCSVDAVPTDLLHRRQLTVIQAGTAKGGNEAFVIENFAYQRIHLKDVCI